MRNPTDVPIDDAALVARLRSGDPAAYEYLVDRVGPAMLRLARLHARDGAAEEIVQDAWIGVLRGIGAFEGRSSLRTWILRIVVNIARSRGEREHRQVPFSAFADEADRDASAVPADRFLPAGHPYARHWVSLPGSWEDDPVLHLESAETLAAARRALEGLPRAQRAVVTLRDVEGWTSEEVCAALGISAVNQRVLLHRGRSRVREALDRHREALGPDREVRRAG